MARIVMKFGGTSMAGLERIRAAADRVKREVDAGNEVAVVVSAMAGETDRLVRFCQEAAPLHDPQEYDVVVSSGEQVTAGLLAIVLQSKEVNARSWLGWQMPMHTTSAHSSARIRGIDSEKMLAAMADGVVAVVPGFQGLSESGRVTTLGRGGSDTSAVAVAAALKADRCDIYTDVDGVYTTDPRIVPRARKLDRITFEEMLELASVGAKVLQTRSVELAMKQGVQLRVLSSFRDVPGTDIVNEDEIVEDQLITGIAYNRAEAEVTLTKVPDTPGCVAAIFEPLAEHEVNVDMIIQNIADQQGRTDVTFTVNRTEIPRVMEMLKGAQDKIGYETLSYNDKVCKLSVVGVGMRSHTGVASTMFKALGERGINIESITTSEIKISVLIAEEYTELAVRVLHSAYGLDAAEEETA
ncbi:aspartate kinase [Pacificimonas flava]|uniref:Aspartokinase n=2 Tax=Pacificimonas TaxID=1960290 RepID=A0A219B454_9SPHN|nr:MULTISPECIES: aspartate kinase [Pacificimonas]MBZ6377757.1 aspartate kinase [Pacificimonas aurantium]OWV32568.1 aspartate kinase [Pacificimonas flava]